MADSSYITQTLQKLVRINSVNPSLEDTGAGEKEIGLFITDELDKAGITPEIDELAPGRINVTGIIPGSGNGKSLILNAHMDTVGVAGMDDPFSGRIKNGNLYGRGSYDMKGSIAAILDAGKRLIQEKIPLRGDVILSFVADEEFESIGAKRFVEKYKADAAIVTEPTDLQICLAHRGFGVYKVETKGKTAHGGNHKLGTDANMKMGLLLKELEKHARNLPGQKQHPLCGEASVHVPLIKGGNSLFIYSDACTIHVERRTLPSETKDQVTRELLAIIHKLEKNDPDFKASLECIIWRDPYETAPDTPIVKELQHAFKSVLGINPPFIGHTWWEDSAIFGQSGIETVIAGPKGKGIHEATEWVEIDSVVNLSDILYDTSVRFCR